MTRRTSNAYTARVQRVMDFARDNPTDDLKLETLASVASFSPFHFHRIFKSVTGETLGEFTRRARLERAAYLMKASPARRLASIALDVGFASHSEFSRAFRRLYGVAPSLWDRKSRIDARPVPARADAPTHDSTWDPSAESRVVDRDACRVAYVRTRALFGLDDLSPAYKRLTTWADSRDIDWREGTLLGMSWDNYETTPLDRLHYDLGFSVPDGVGGGGDVGIYELPATRSIDVRCEGGLEKIATAWDYLYEEWLPRSTYEPDNLPAMKRFRLRPDEIGWSRFDLDCSIALKARLP